MKKLRGRLWVEGVPVPQGSMKGFVVNGKAILTHGNANLKGWRKTVSALIKTANFTAFTKDTPHVLMCVFHLPRPKYHYNKAGLKANAPTLHWKKPDLDKLLRAIGDALVDAKAIDDDSRICEEHVKKVYANDKPGVYIELHEIGD